MESSVSTASTTAIESSFSSMSSCGTTTEAEEWMDGLIRVTQSDRIQYQNIRRAQHDSHLIEVDYRQNEWKDRKDRLLHSLYMRKRHSDCNIKNDIDNAMFIPDYSSYLEHHPHNNNNCCDDPTAIDNKTDENKNNKMNTGNEFNNGEEKDCSEEISLEEEELENDFVVHLNHYYQVQHLETELLRASHQLEIMSNQIKLLKKQTKRMKLYVKCEANVMKEETIQVQRSLAFLVEQQREEIELTRQHNQRQLAKQQMVIQHLESTLPPTPPPPSPPSSPKPILNCIEKKQKDFSYDVHARKIVMKDSCNCDKNSTPTKQSSSDDFLQSVQALLELDGSFVAPDLDYLMDSISDMQMVVSKLVQ